jgi:hypothetical protein
MTTIQNTINHTNAKLATWYSNVKLDFNVIGNGKAIYNEHNNEVVINYVENGVKAKWSHYFHQDFNINTIFNIWQTDANIETDEIN